MRLYEKMAVPCHMVDGVTTPGPTGPVTVWKDGAPIRATITKNRSIQAQEAEKAGVTSLYTITAMAPLHFHDVVRRDSDGATFRVTSNSEDSQPPEVATFTFTQVTAERWDIP